MNKTTYKFLDKINLPSDLRKFENHKRYIFHITLAYILEKLNCTEIRNICEYDKKLLNKFKKEYPKITLNNPEMTTFKNMYKFKSINLSSQ